MNWKPFTIVCINIVCISFPYNIIGCGGDYADPYDYYVSFFNNNLAEAKGYEPFYYTDLLFLYRTKEPENAAMVTAEEWTPYANNSFSPQEAYEFVCRFARKDLSNLYFHLEKNQPLQLPDSVQRNGMTKFFLNSRDLEALGYLMYAKQVEPNVIGEWTSWDLHERDTVKMDKLIKNGWQLHAAAKKDFTKLRLAYQVLRLAHYSNRFQECLHWYDELVKPNATKSALQDLCLGLKAGALMRLGKSDEAAYIFSQLFSKNEFKRVSNFRSFDWCVDRLSMENRNACLAFCKSDLEKANLLGLFALGSNNDELNTLEQIHELAPQSPLNEILLVREMNKLEENYFEPSLQFKRGESEAVTAYETIRPSDQAFLDHGNELEEFITFCQQAAQKKETPNKALYSLTAAHGLLIKGDYTDSRKWLDNTKKLKLTPKLRDQWGMTNLLWTINQKDTINSKFEKQLLPSLRWLEEKAANDKEYAKFYRRIFFDILSPMYQKSKGSNQVKYVLCVGVADWIHRTFVKDGSYYGNPLGKLRKDLSALQVEQLIQLMESKKLNAFERYIVEHNAFSKDDVNDAAGTSWLRQFNWAMAEKWLNKVPENYYQNETYKYYLGANPFADLILDTHRPTEQDTVTYTKLGFTRKMIQLEHDLKATTDAEKQARLHYQIACGLYQMSYWGNSWLLVKYFWSGEENSNPSFTSKDPFDIEYYGVFTSEIHYRKAFSLTKDRNFQARCLFMMAKCDQNQLPIPAYEDFPNFNQREYEETMARYQKSFQENPPAFSTLAKDYSNTPFYKEAYNTCSYLSDFVRKLK